MNVLSLEEKQDSLDVLNYQIRVCAKCRLAETRKNALTGEGNIQASILFVALSPGSKEDTGNRMFIGPSGQVFNRLLQAAGIEREAVYMTNLVKCTLPKNRKPSQQEIEACSAFLDDEIRIIQPKIIAPLGFYATRSVLQKFQPEAAPDINFKAINGQVLQRGSTNIFPLTHPSALLYNPAYEPATRENYIKLKSLV